MSDELAIETKGGKSHGTTLIASAADYLSRVRVEKAKNLLPNPDMRISEVAFAAGFQSLSHFNRVFRRIVASRRRVIAKKLPKA